MKTCYTLLVAMFFASVLCAQEFEWAYLIDNFEANEVAGLATDDSGNVYLCGVYGADASLPYDGTAYLTKTDADGAAIWTKYLGDELVIGDMICAGDNVFIVAQSTSNIQCNGLVFEGAPAGPFMALIVLDQNDGSGFVNYYPQNHGQHAHIAAHGDVVAVQCAGEFNQGEHVIFLDVTGTELASHELDIDANVNDIAFHDGNTYLSGHTNFPQSVSIDNVNIPAGEIDGLTFILGFDEAFVAQWGYADDALNAQDGQVVADSSGIYSYQTTINSSFQSTPFIWKFDVNGNLLDSVVAPTFNANGTLYPDMAISDCHVLLMASNAFDNNSHELTIFDHDLNIIDEKQINGNSNFYSGQVASFDNQIYVSHVHMDELDFNGEVMISDELDDAFQFPYLAKVGVGEDCGASELLDCELGEISYELWDCVNGEFFVDIWFEFESTADSFHVMVDGEFMSAFNYQDEFYTIGPIGAGSDIMHELTVVDWSLDSCMSSVDFAGVDCGIGDCGIFDLEVFDELCDSDSTFSFFFNAEIIDPGFDFLEVWVNGESYGNFEIEELPIQLGGVIPYDSEWQVLEVCVNEQPDCCTELAFIAPLCLDTVNCVIGEVEYEVWDCIEGEFFLDFWFDSNNTTESFDIYGNGDFYGNFEYGEDFYTIGPFPSGSDVLYEMFISDTGLDACVNFFEFQGIDCAIGDCYISELSTYDVTCDSDSTFSFYLDAEVYDPGNEFFELWLDGEYLGFFPIADIPVHIEGVGLIDQGVQPIYACVNDVPECCTEGEVLVPYCPGDDCAIYNIQAQALPCVDNEFYVDVWFDSANTSDSFTLTGGGNSYGTFSYSESLYTIGPFPSGISLSHELIFTDDSLSDCSSITYIDGVDCSIFDCAIYEFGVYGHELNDDGTYSMYVEAEFYYPGNEFFDVWINDEYFGFYAIADMPVLLNPITPSDLEMDNIMICVNDNDSCCVSEDYLRPAGPDGLHEFENSFSISPNPAEDIVQITLGVKAQISTISLYDVNGKLLLRTQDSKIRQLDVSEFERGVYLLVLTDQQGNRLSRRLVK